MAFCRVNDRMISQAGSRMRVFTTVTAIATAEKDCHSSRRRTSALKSMNVRNAMNNPILAHHMGNFLFSFNCVPTLKYKRIRMQNKAIHSKASTHKTKPGELMRCQRSIMRKLEQRQHPQQYSFFYLP